MDEFLDPFVQFATTHLFTTANMYLVLGTYVLIWAMEPVVRLLISQLPPPKQLIWWSRQKVGKNFAAIFWCELFVWIPTAQPPLCEGGPGSDCQTVVERVFLGVILGGGLSLLHKYFLSWLKRKLGLDTKLPEEVTRLTRG